MTSPTATVLCRAWATWADLSPAQQAAADPPVWDRNLTWASELLYALTQHRWPGPGCGPVTVVLRANTSTWPYDQSWGACACWGSGQWVSEQWIPSPFAGLHHAPTSIRLPHTHPTVTAVTIDAVAFTGWEVTPGGWLSRTDGRPWSLCLPTGETRVTYTHGTPPPAGGVRAAVALGAELVTAELGKKCRLAGNTVSVTRQGYSQQLVSRAVSQLAGGTGLPEVDTWIRSVNPAGRADRGRVWSPDMPGASTVLQSGGP